MSDLVGLKAPQKKVHVVNTVRSLPNLSPITRTESPLPGIMVHSKSSDKRAKNKERARRNLVDTLSLKRPTVVSLSRGVTHSYNDRKIPSSLRHPGPDLSVRRKDVLGLQYNPGFEHLVTEVEADLDESLDYLDIHQRHSRMHGYSSLNKSDTNLPQLIHDLNSGMKYPDRRDNSSWSSGDDGDGYNGEDVMQKLSQLWDKSRRSKDGHNKQWVRHRPITPTLLERLDKMKVPARTRTEQWVKQIPTEKRAYHSPLYRLGNVTKDDDDAVVTPAMYESWIYEETRRSARGGRKPRQT